MPFNLRQRAEQDLGISLEGQWGLPVELVGPDGVEYKTSNNDPTKPLVGQVQYNRIEANPETGEEILIPMPVIALRRSSLARVPQNGEKWLVRIPIDPDPAAAKIDFIFFGKPIEGGRSIGFLRIYPQEAEQL